MSKLIPPEYDGFRPGDLLRTKWQKKLPKVKLLRFYWNGSTLWVELDVSSNPRFIPATALKIRWVKPKR